jgi:hypothetical protein
MNAPWIEVDENRDQDVLWGSGDAEYTWQALFACQVNVLPHQEWVKLKWGFNASALFDEALERQRLFLESRYTVQHEGIEPPDRCTLAFRFINRPGEGLLVAMVGKIRARTRAEAVEQAVLYFQELKATFPYDYSLVPASSRQEFLHMTGQDLLEEKRHLVDLAQIKRAEVPSTWERGSPFLQGFWRSGAHAHEQIWRSLGTSLSPVLLNMTLRSTFLYQKERERLLKASEDAPDQQRNGSPVKTWNKEYVERRLTLWKKFFYLEVHLASPRKLSDSLCRLVGTSLTLSGDGQAQPGYLVVCPEPDEAQSWRTRLKHLDLIFPRSPLAVPRLSEVADLDEVFAVMRLPYSPPESGFPDLRFKSPQE